MRILLDQNIDDEILIVLRTLHLDVTHVADIGHATTDDIPLFVIARDYDCLVTLDLHRQEGEWLALYAEMIEHGVAIVRVKLTETFGDPDIEVTRALTYRMADWIRCIEEGACLVMIAKGGAQIRARTREDVAKTLEERLKHRGLKAP